MQEFSVKLPATLPEAAGPEPAEGSADSSVFDLSDCTLCPRNCHVNRLAGETGACGEGAEIRAARAALLTFEEPCLTGRHGSGAIFFTGCNLRCVFCQNYAISSASSASPAALSRTGTSCSGHASCSAGTASALHPLVSAGRDRPSVHPGLLMAPERLAERMLALEAEGAANINLVTPTHFVPQLVPVLEAAKRQGLSIPIVYNTGAYEKVEALKRLDGLIDIYLPDLKYYSDALALRFSRAPHYFAAASAAIAEMVRQCPAPLFADGSSSLDCEDDADDPVMLHGVIVRHLALPGCGEDSRAVLRYLHETYGSQIFISLMSQYTPMPQTAGDPLLSRRLSPKEYEALADYAVGLGIENGFLQEGDAASESFIPAFDGTGLLPGTPANPAQPATPNMPANPDA